MLQICGWQLLYKPSLRLTVFHGCLASGQTQRQSESSETSLLPLSAFLSVLKLYMKPSGELWEKSLLQPFCVVFFSSPDSIHPPLG